MKRKKSTFNRLLFSRFLLVFSLMVLVNGTISSQTKTIDIQAHSNHYILLIDASGSTVSNETKSREYREILTVDLLNQLYQEGFGQSIPPFKPGDDLLSIFHFGIVPQGYDKPYRYLANYDLLTDFVQPLMIREKEISKDNLENRIKPRAYYMLTILAWAKPLALNALLMNNFDGVSNRVFLIMVHDGEVNNGLLEREREMVERWSNQDKIGDVKKSIEFIDTNYMFSNCQGREGWAWNKRFTTNGEPIFLEAYEIISPAREKRISQLEELNPVTQLKFHWTTESGNEPEGYLKVTLEEKFHKFLDNQNTAVEVTFIHSDNKKQGQVEFESILKFPVIFSHPLNCKPMECQVQLNIPFRQQDPLLGTRNMNYHYQGKVETPIPFRCSFIFVINWIFLVLVIMILLAIGLWFYYFRFYIFPIKVRFPGLSFPIIAKRNKNISGGTPVHPKPGMPAFTIRLPHKWIQFILLRKARINLKPEVQKDEEKKKGKEKESKIYWAEKEEKLDAIELPEKHKKINIWWRTIPKEPLDLTINLAQEKHKSEIRLNFPKGISRGGKK